MNRVFRATPRSRVRTALAAIAVVLALAACSPTGADSVRVVPAAQPVYPQVKTYPSIRVQENIDYSPAHAGPRQLDVCLPSKKDPSRAAILSIHGGSWRAGDKANINWRSVCQWLASEGFVVFSVDYRLAPQFPFPSAIDDVRAAVRFMRDPKTVKRYDIDPNRIGAFGGSAGGNLAALLGAGGSGDWTTGSRVAAVAELSGPIDLTAAGEELGPAAPEFRQFELEYLGCVSLADCPQAEAASPLYQVDHSDPPFFIGHSLDERIPLAQSEAMVRALRKHGVDTTFVTVKGTLHSIAMLNKDLRSRIATFLHAKLDG
jgi:acetyl esterase/lipase